MSVLAPKMMRGFNKAERWCQCSLSAGIKNQRSYYSSLGKLMSLLII